jgi:hypothetical protein
MPGPRNPGHSGDGATAATEAIVNPAPTISRVIHAVYTLAGYQKDAQLDAHIEGPPRDVPEPRPTVLTECQWTRAHRSATMIGLRQMASKPGFLDYVSAAFSARPLGMFVAPNWIGLAAAGLLGVVDPGFWVLGAGLELAYLLTLATNGRFQRFVDAKQSIGTQGDSIARKGDLLGQLRTEDRQRFAEFEQRAQSILVLQNQTSTTTLAGIEEQKAGLNRLTWMYLRLLSARRVIEHVLEGADVAGRQGLEAKRATLQKQAGDEAIDAEIRRSLSSQIEILTQRIDRRAEAERKLGFLDAEVERLEQQVELIREQAALSTDPAQLSLRIDEITASLGTTSQWIRDQQQVFGAMDDLLSDAPPMSTKVSSKTSARELQ